MSAGIQIRPALSFCILLSICILGCEGDPGSPGMSRLGDDLQPPSVEIIQPLPGKDIYRTVVLEVLAQDDNEVVSVEFLIDGAIAEELTISTPPWQVRWDCEESFPAGQHTLQARALDAAGREGLSRLLLINKAHADSLRLVDTLRYFVSADDDDYRPGDDYFAWPLPAIQGDVRGVGTRFIPDGPCMLTGLYIRTFWDFYWQFAGISIDVSIYSSDQGVIDSLLGVVSVGGRLPLTEGDQNIWKSVRIPGGRLSIDGEFFVTVSLPAEPADTLAVLSDNGLWNNRHGIVLRADGWTTFEAGSRKAFNPLIYAVIEYPEQ